MIPIVEECGNVLKNERDPEIQFSSRFRSECVDRDKHKRYPEVCSFDDIRLKRCETGDNFVASRFRRGGTVDACRLSFFGEAHNDDGTESFAERDRFQILCDPAIVSFSRRWHSVLYAPVHYGNR